MATEEEPCADAKKVERIDAAFRRGDLEALRAAVEDPDAVPNGRMPDAVGPCLIYAIYHSPLGFIRRLLEIGADPNAAVDDGFPPLIAALSCAGEAPGARARSDVAEILQLLLEWGTDPDVRGINDYTALHMAVAQGDARAVRLLLDKGANAELRTRIDECVTPLEMAAAAARADLVQVLSQAGRQLRRRLRSGLILVDDIPGDGDVVRRQRSYRVRLRLWLNRGEAVRWPADWAPAGYASIENDGETLVTQVRLSRGSLMNGLFYGVEGMRVGGTRRLEIAPHMAFGERGVPGAIPAGAALTAEITVLAPS